MRGQTRGILAKGAAGVLPQELNLFDLACPPALGSRGVDDQSALLSRRIMPRSLAFVAGWHEYQSVILQSGIASATGSQDATSTEHSLTPSLESEAYKPRVA